MVYANTTKHDWPDDIWDAICQAIKAEKHEVSQEPVAVINSTISGDIDWLCTVFPKQGTKLYTHPQQSTWVGLTHEEIDYQAKKDDNGAYFALGALWAEAKLKEKNT